MDADNFYLHVSAAHLEELIERYVHQIEQVIELHHEDDLEKELENVKTGEAVDSSRSVDRTTALYDRDFENEKQQLPTTCLECKWEGPFKFYQGHLNQNHQAYSIYSEQIAQDNPHQQILYALHGYTEHFQVMSFDGTFTWKIENFQEQRMDAISERQKSIYSPPFYSSSTGYKMCLRLFLNGDSCARNKHMSLFLVLMCGNNDAIVHWPFNCNVEFTLLDQLQSNNNRSKFFWPDTTSSSFQRPSLDMNNSYGFSEFYSLNLFEQNKSHFVRDDVMFIKVKIDSRAEVPEIHVNDDANELLNDETHVDTINDNPAVAICHSDTFQ